MICQPASQDGIEPMWEDSRNRRGGRWLVSLAKQQRHSELDHLWLETVSGGLGEEASQGKGLGWCVVVVSGWWGQTLCPPGSLILLLFWLQLLCLIGESFEEHSREVCGAVINIRTKGDKIAVWTRETENQEGVLRIG